MEVTEHFYRDDPTQGPPDAKTTLAGVDYFFLGNGLIQAAVQVCSGEPGTPVGLLILPPGRLQPKRCALTFDPEVGLASTAVSVRAGSRIYAPCKSSLDARWAELDGVPAAQIAWRDDDLRVEETFYCPEPCAPRLVRVIRVVSAPPGLRDAVIRTGPGHEPLEQPIALRPAAPSAATICYEVCGTDQDLRVEARWTTSVRPGGRSATDPRRLAALTSSSPTLEHLFVAARNQLPAVVAASGQMDGSIWQYNLEWVRDQSMVAAALVMLGEFATARTMLERMLTRFVSAEGDTVDSGRRRPPAEVELDQNGHLLLALETYANWTSDTALLQRHWPRIQAVAEFPLRPEFRHEASGLLHNRREYWERHAVHGICDGMELAHQLYVSVGLTSAAGLARRVARPELAAHWTAAAQRIRGAMLGDARCGLVEKGRFIKRRDVRGAVQETITPAAEAGLPRGVPLCREGQHYLNPDTSTVLPIALEFVDPRDELARNTLAAIEQLWNQHWSGGGYGRYHVSSEPDSPGPWPFASLFVARAHFEAGDDRQVWRVLNWLRAAPGGRAGSWFEFYGPRPIPPYPQVGVVPWTWAEIVCLLIHHLLGVRPEADELVLRPRLLADLDWVDVRLHWRTHELHMALRRPHEGESPAFVVDGARLPYSPAGVRLPIPDADLDIQVVAPA